MPDTSTGMSIGQPDEERVRNEVYAHSHDTLESAWLSAARPSKAMETIIAP